VHALPKQAQARRTRERAKQLAQCLQAIRNHIRNGVVPGEQIGKLWYVDWTAFNRSYGNDLVAMVLKGAA
jgi:hypothetical protein